MAYQQRFFIRIRESRPITAMLLLMLECSSAVVIRVTSCPRNTSAWTKRSNSFGCRNQNYVYHCIYSDTGTLVETCMKSQAINERKVGCPWVKIYHGIPYLRSPFRECDPNNPGCPELPHTEYSTNELYKYDTCINGSEKNENSNRDVTTEQPSYCGVIKVHLGFIIPIIAVLMIAIILLSLRIRTYNVSRKNARRKSTFPTGTNGSSSTGAYTEFKELISNESKQQVEQSSKCINTTYSVMNDLCNGNIHNIKKQKTEVLNGWVTV